MKKLKPHSIVIKYFFTICTFIVIPILIFFIIARQVNVQTRLEQKRQSDLATLQTFSSSLQTYMNTVKDIGNLISHDNQVIHFMENSQSTAALCGKSSYKQLDASSCLAPYNQVINSIISIALTDTEGIFIGENSMNPYRLSYFFNPTFMAGLEKEASTWTNSFSIQFSKTGDIKKVFALMVPIYSETHIPLGYVILFMDTHIITELLSSYSDDIYVLENEYIIGSKKEVPPHTNLFSLFQISYSLLLNDSSVIIENSSPPLIVTTKTFPVLGFRLLLISSYDNLKKVAVNSLPSLLTVTIYGVLFAILSSLLIAHFQTKPIFHLKTVMNSVKNEDLGIRFHSHSQDEITELGETFNSLLDTIQELMEEQKKHQKLKRKMELQMIQEQVKPHFLYNVLEMINSMIRCNMNKEAMLTVENLANFYRISLNNGSDIITVSKEIQLIENYLCLQKMRYIEFMDYILALSPAIYEFSIPKLTLQPIVENAIYHGIKEKGTKATLCISGYLEDGAIVFEIFDTGNGISPPKIQALMESIQSEKDIDSHFGLASVYKRLNIFCGNQAKLAIESKLNEYTCIVISFPAQKL